MKAPTISLLAAALLASAVATAATKNEPQKSAQPQPSQGQSQQVVNGFEPVAGEAGWQLAQHRYVIVGGRFVHGSDCDHAVRPAPAAPTPAELETLRRLYPSG